MITGVETAGLVLAVLPLFIAALEHYQEGMQPIIAFVQWKNQLPVLIRALRTQHVHYEQNLKALLAPVASRDEIAQMLADPSGFMWKDDDLGERLKERLGEAYEAYYDTILDIEKLMKKISNVLNIEQEKNEDFPNRGDLNTFLKANPYDGNKFEFKKRVKVGMSKKNMHRLTAELNKHNKTLERFGEKSEKLAPYRSFWKSPFPVPLYQIREYASDLHNALSVRWNCSCQAAHNAKLQLEKRILPSKSEGKAMKNLNEDASRRTSFSVFFSIEIEVAENQIITGKWQETEIRVIEEADKMMKPGLAVATRSVSAPEIPRVRFLDFPAPSLSQQDEFHDHTSLPEVTDLCTAIREYRSEATPLGFCLDRKGKLRGVYHIKKDRVSDAKEMITLEELLSNPTTARYDPGRLSQLERLTIAVNLASSLLQLHATPWLNEAWSKKDIWFFRANGTSSKKRVDFEQPYVSYDFAGPEATSLPPCNTQKANRIHHGNPSLLSLGIVLLELWLDTPIENVISEMNTSDEAAGKASTILWTAQQWENDAAGELPYLYRKAVQHCIRCFFDPLPPTTSLHDGDFMKAVSRDVIVSLQEELRLFLEGPRIS